MEIQQHDGVVVDVAGCRQGFAEHIREREREVLQGEREAPKAVILLPSLPPIYRPPGRGGAGQNPSRVGGGGQGGCLAPQGKWEAPHPRVSNPRRMGGGPWGSAQPTRGWFPSHFSPRGPPG